MDKKIPTKSHQEQLVCSSSLFPNGIAPTTGITPTTAKEAN
jgi:hypothetical protein